MILATEIETALPDLDYSWFTDRLIEFFGDFGDLPYALLNMISHMPSFWSTFLYLLFIFSFIGILIKVMFK